MKKSNKVYKFNSDLDKAYRQLFGPSNPAGCSVCGDEGIDTLSIHKIEGKSGLQVLCRDCHTRIMINDCSKPGNYTQTQGIISCQNG